MHISTAFDGNFLREEIILSGKHTSKKYSSSIAGDNINRIIEMANGRTKAAESQQRDIDELNNKIQAGNEELAIPFPQQEEYEKLLLRSKELINLLNEDSNDNAKHKAEIETEKNNRIETIMNGTPETVCEFKFFNFVKDNLGDSSQDWSQTLDETAIQLLVNDGFPKDTISDTVVKFSPAVPSREEVYYMIENCTSRTASCR